MFNGEGVEIFEQAQSENKIVIESHSEPLPTSQKDINIRDDYLADDSPIVFSSSTDTDNLIQPESSKRPVRSDESCGRTWKRSRIHEGDTYPLYSNSFLFSHALSPHASGKCCPDHSFQILFDEKFINSFLF